MNLEKYHVFINEQREFFENNIQPTFKLRWDDSAWYGGTIGSGWLLSRSGRVHFLFNSIKKLKGVKSLFVDPTYQEFMKAVMVLSYRKSNSKASPQKLYAEILVLKRWYNSLYNENPNTCHPCTLSTSTLNQSFEILKENASKTNLPDHAGTYLRLQELLNHYCFTEKNLEFSQKYLYINRQNRTPNAKRTKALIDQLDLDEDDLNTDKLISIRTFINIISLISLCQTNGEKIVLNLLLLLIITGLRSTEAILLKTDALIKQPILDPVTKEHLSIDGVKQYTLGIQYHGAKGAGFRIHWVEPLAANLVETIFASVLELTKEFRERILYLRSKDCKDFLPESIDRISEDFIEIDDLIDTVFAVKDNYRGHAGRREVVIKTLSKVPIYKEITIGSKVKKYYLKKDLDTFIRSFANYDSDQPLNHVFNYEGKIENIPYEDILFIHEYRSATLQRAFYNKTNIIPLSANIINSFLGSSNNVSAFQKYSLLENETEHSKLTSHIPRHNINTFLALSGLAEHLQAMLMGRVDIKQNQHYQHLALKQHRVAASILEKHELVVSEFPTEQEPVKYPIDSVKNDGLMYFSTQLDLESNLKMNLQSFDSKNEVASYIKKSFFDEYFEDITQSFNELTKNNEKDADELVQRHANLHPLPFGGCMREIAVHDCPKRLACQSGDQCGNFALTGRKGELETLQHTLNKLLNQFQHIEKILAHDFSYGEMLENLHQKILYLSDLKAKALDRQKNLTPIPVFPYENTISKLPTTLSELFAIEQQKIESKEA
ncbi:hypothetical protein [Acinetobacter pittii]|uniref:Uncharacterized protein n=1 Tax=Acinetobacter pittii ANC 4050 TaxID=1217691 RepID=R8YK16_ACIPI|nr:hypothetical protein [Acinetobacter pittii]EOQ69760.1 hypothetical protein F931_00961 [Acinetobacter pittii ANC 4050]